MPTREPVFTKQSLLNRQNSKLKRAFAILFDSEDLVVSHDRYCLFRPTKNVEIRSGVCVSPLLSVLSVSYFSQMKTDLHGSHLRHFIWI